MCPVGQVYQIPHHSYPSQNPFYSRGVYWCFGSITLFSLPGMSLPFSSLVRFLLLLPSAFCLGSFPSLIRLLTFLFFLALFANLYQSTPNQSILKEISPGCSLEGLMLKLQCFGHLMQRVHSLENTLMLGGIEGRRRRGWQRMRWLGGITDSTVMSLSKLWEWWWTGRPGVLRFTESQRVGHDWATGLNWLTRALTRLRVTIK